MTNRELLKCINYVDDRLIVQTNEYIGKYVNKRKRLIIPFLVTAACIVIIVTTSVISKVSLFNKPSNENITTFSNDNLVSPIYTFVLEGYIYEVIYNQKTIEKEGLPRKIEESMLGEVLAKDVIRDGVGDYLGDVYEYKEIADRSVVIIKDYTGNYYYAVRCNVYDNTVY